MCSMRILTLTTLFPNAHQPAHGIFVENRLAHLVASGKVAARVVAPVAWVPDLPFLPERYRRLGGVPAREERHGIVIDHPRYLLPPKVGMLWAPLSLYRAARRAAARASSSTSSTPTTSIPTASRRRCWRAISGSR